MADNTLNKVEEDINIVLNEHDEVKEIIGNPPSWILQWGIMVILFIVCIIGFMSWLIKYPDTIEAAAILTTENPAIRVVAQRSGKLEELYVQNQDLVKKGQILALLESNTNWNDIKRLQKLITDIEQSKNLLKIQIPDNLSLGIIQAAYTKLVQQLKDQQHFLRQRLDQVKQQSASKQIEHYKQLNEGLERQITIFEKEVALIKDKYQRNYGLYKSGAISLLELQDFEATYLQYQRQLEGLESQRINNQVTIEQLHTQIADIQQNRQNGLDSRLLAIEENCRQINNDIAVWEQAYLIKASISGQVSTNKAWAKQQFITANSEVFTILPAEGIGEVIVKASMPTKGIGKVKSGMKANIALDGYPQQEYGVLSATVYDIALMPTIPQGLMISNEEEGPTASYLIKLHVNDDLKTTYDKIIPFRQEMPGIAEIITEERRIIDRVLDKILDVLKNN